MNQETEQKIALLNERIYETHDQIHIYGTYQALAKLALSHRLGDKDFCEYHVAQLKAAENHAAQTTEVLTAQMAYLLNEQADLIVNVAKEMDIL